MDHTFKDNTYTSDALEAMSDEELLTLRNDIAEALDVAKIETFPDHKTAVAQTMKALERHTKQAGAAVKAPKAAKAPKAPKEPKGPRPIPKSAMAKTVKRPTRAMFATIKKTGEHDGSSHGRADRWPNYKDGMTMVDVTETEGTEPWDVYNWQKHGIMEVTEPTDAEYEQRKAAWYKKEGRADPEVEKAEKKAAAEKARAEKAAEKEAAEKAKAEKKAAAATAAKE